MIRVTNVGAIGDKKATGLTYEDVEGTPFWDDHWNTALLYFKSGAIYKLPKAKLNLYTAEVHYANDKDGELVAETNLIDKIVFLDRKNIKEQLESLSHSLTTNTWHTSYVYSDKKHNKFIDEELKHMLFWKEQFHTLAKDKNTKVFYYEDIYSTKENMLEFLKAIGSNYNEIYYNKFLDNYYIII